MIASNRKMLWRRRCEDLMDVANQFTKINFDPPALQAVELKKSWLIDQSSTVG